MHFSVAPTLETERLVLRPYRQSDFEAFADYFGSLRSIYTDGPGICLQLVQVAG